MSLHHHFTALACVLLPAFASAAGTDNGEVAELKRMLVQMQQRYEQRISTLEDRLAKDEETLKGTSTQAGSATTQAAQAQQTAASAQQAAIAASSAGDNANAFNPAIALVLQGKAISYSRDPKLYALPGFQLGGDAGLEDEGLGLGETEMNLRANVDQLFYGEATLSLANSATNGTSIDVEEGFLDTLALPWGLGLRFGRFFNEVGYLNTHHSHTWDFVDAPLTSQAFLGGQYGDDGLRLNWIAPTDTYLELGLELLRGSKFPASGKGGHFLGASQNAYLRIDRDLDDSNNVLLGLSYLRTHPTDRRGGDFSFAGHSGLSAADLVWKWAPHGNAYRHSFKLQTEYFYRHETGQQRYIDPAGTAATALLPYSGDQQGFYAQGVYKFMPRWRMGLRYDRLWSDNGLRIASNGSSLSSTDLLNGTGLLDNGHDPSRWTAMLDFSPSEFSRLRLQFAADDSRGSGTDYQTMLQYIMSIGSHGAHTF